MFNQKVTISVEERQGGVFIKVDGKLSPLAAGALEQTAYECRAGAIAMVEMEAFQNGVLVEKVDDFEA